MEKKEKIQTSNERIKQDTGEVYTTKNVIIRKIGQRLTDKIGNLLRDIQADTLFGLDIGCAEGHLLAELKRQGIVGSITAVELEWEKISSFVATGQDISIIQGDACEIGLKDGAFDYILATEVLEHLPQPQLALAEMRRVAKPKAPVILSVPYEPYFHIGNLCRGKHLHRGGRTPSHLHFWHRKEFRRFIAPYLDIERECTITTFPWLLYLCTTR